VVSVRSPEDIQLEQLETLMGYATAIKDGESTVDEVFNAETTDPAPMNFPMPRKEVTESKTGSEPAGESQATPAAGGTEAPSVTHATETQPEVAISLQDQLANIVTSAGYSFDELKVAANGLHALKDGEDEAPSFADLSDDTCRKLIGAKRGLLRAMNLSRSVA
jgi:hypothetical protein